MEYRDMFVYVSTNVFCIALVLILLSKFTSNIGNEREIKIFRYMSISFLIFSLTETIWGLSVGNVLPISPLVSGLIKALGTFFIPLMVYFWFTFAETRYHNANLSKPWFKILTFLPIIILFILYATSFWTGLVFKINPEGTTEFGPADNFSGLVNNIYGIAIIIHSIVRLIKDKNKNNRNSYITHIVFIVICTLGGFLDAFAVNTPIMSLAISLSFAYLFINLQEPRIFNDALTGLNNRRRADMYMSETIENYHRSNLHFFMLDIDNFKNINDTKGHLEGDKALKLVSEALENVNDLYHGFLARWGGDEFVMLIRNEEEFQNEFISQINNELNNIAKLNNLPYPLSATIGYTKVNQGDKVADVISRADKDLYQKKNQL